MREMVRYFDRKAGGPGEGGAAIRFPDRKLHYRIRIDRGRNANCTKGAAEQPDLRVRCDAAVWAGIFTRQTDVREALQDRRLVLDGDKSLFSRLDRLFPPPSS